MASWRACTQYHGQERIVTARCQPAQRVPEGVEGAPKGLEIGQLPDLARQTLKRGASTNTRHTRHTRTTHTVKGYLELIAGEVEVAQVAEAVDLAGEGRDVVARGIKMEELAELAQPRVERSSKRVELVLRQVEVGERYGQAQATHPRRIVGDDKPVVRQTELVEPVHTGKVRQLLEPIVAELELSEVPSMRHSRRERPEPVVRQVQALDDGQSFEQFCGAGARRVVSFLSA